MAISINDRPEWNRLESARELFRVMHREARRTGELVTCYGVECWGGKRGEPIRVNYAAWLFRSEREISAGELNAAAAYRREFGEKHRCHIQIERARAQRIERTHGRAAPLP